MAWTRQLFLYGGRTENFAVTIRPFIAAAGGARARIALLFSTGAAGWDRHLAQYRGPSLEAGAEEVVAIHPLAGTPTLGAEAHAYLSQCTGLFMCGGDTRLYHRVYAGGAAGQILLGAYRRGVPYGGLSAGALLAPRRCLLYGDRLSTGGRRLRLRGAEDGCDADLVVGTGLGLLDDLLIEAHFSERGGYPRLIAGMQEANVPYGLGIDDDACVWVRDEDLIEVTGTGRVYGQRRCGPRTFEALVMERGERHSLSRLRTRGSTT